MPEAAVAVHSEAPSETIAAEQQIPLPAAEVLPAPEVLPPPQPYNPVPLDRMHAALRGLDSFIHDPAKAPFWGWHDEQDYRPQYAPVIQQIQHEFQSFMWEAAGVVQSGKLVQIGLGMCGGTHVAFRQLFDQVFTIDVDERNIRRFSGWYTVDARHDHILYGNSHDPAVVSYIQQAAAGADVLFLDGGHLFHEIRKDWDNYASIVRPGGIVAFHDSVSRPDEFDVLQVDVFLHWLREGWLKKTKRRLYHIGAEIGISFYRV